MSDKSTPTAKRSAIPPMARSNKLHESNQGSDNRRTYRKLIERCGYKEGSSWATEDQVAV